VPNIVLNNLWIENVSRSKAMKEVIDVNISYDTSFEDIELLRLEMEKFVRHPDNARDFQPDLSISVFSMGDLDRMQLKLAMKHKSNWHNDAVRATRRSKFMCALALALKRVPIYGPGGGAEALGGPTNPAYSVTVSDELAAAARDKAARDKEGKRMIKAVEPARAGSTTSKYGTKDAEKKAAQELNTRNPAVEAADGWALNVDDNTLNSRDESLERKRSRDIEAVRQELLGKRESQRGRRVPGQGLPPMPLSESSTSSFPAQPRSRTNQFDVESQTGRPAGFGPTPYGNMTTTTAAAAAAAQSSSAYSVFPPTRTYSPPSSSSNNFAGLQGAAAGAGSPHPLQSQPTASGRPRGASASRPLIPSAPSQSNVPGAPRQP